MRLNVPDEGQQIAENERARIRRFALSNRLLEEPRREREQQAGRLQPVPNTPDLPILGREMQDPDAEGDDSVTVMEEDGDDSRTVMEEERIVIRDFAATAQRESTTARERRQRRVDEMERMLDEEQDREDAENERRYENGLLRTPPQARAAAVPGTGLERNRRGSEHDQRQRAETATRDFASWYERPMRQLRERRRNRAEPTTLTEEFRQEQEDAELEQLEAEFELLRANRDQTPPAARASVVQGTGPETNRGGSELEQRRRNLQQTAEAFMPWIERDVFGETGLPRGILQGHRRWMGEPGIQLRPNRQEVQWREGVERVNRIVERERAQGLHAPTTDPPPPLPEADPAGVQVVKEALEWLRRWCPVDSNPNRHPLVVWREELTRTDRIITLTRDWRTAHGGRWPRLVEVEGGRAGIYRMVDDGDSSNAEEERAMELSFGEMEEQEEQEDGGVGLGGEAEEEGRVEEGEIGESDEETGACAVEEEVEEEDVSQHEGFSPVVGGRGRIFDI